MSCTPSETTHEDAFRRIPTHFARAAALRRTGITSVHLHDNLARLQHITGNRPLVLNELGNGQLALTSKPTCNSAARGEPVRAAALDARGIDRDNAQVRRSTRERRAKRKRSF